VADWFPPWQYHYRRARHLRRLPRPRDDQDDRYAFRLWEMVKHEDMIPDWDFGRTARRTVIHHSSPIINIWIQ
jgi:hypothetical protein